MRGKAEMATPQPPAATAPLARGAKENGRHLGTGIPAEEAEGRKVLSRRNRVTAYE